MAKPGRVKSKDVFPAAFSRHAQAYQRRIEQIMSRGEARGRMRAIELVDARPGMRILDLACGPGNITARLASIVSPGGEVVGVDLAEGMIEIARSAGIPNARFEVMDIEALTFADASFDGAVCAHGLQFAPDLDRALREVRRVLWTGGPFAASVPATPLNQSVWELLDSVIDRWLPPPPQVVDRAATRVVIGDVASFRQAALDAGFTSAAVEVIDEEVRWPSAEQLVSLFTGWWDCAVRLEGVEPSVRHGFEQDAVTTLRREHPGTIVTTGRTNVLSARA